MIFFNITKIASTQLITLLVKNIIGTPGHGMRYQHLEVLKKISSIKRPFFISLQRNNLPIATCCFCNREVLNCSKPKASFYLRYFTFSEKFRTGSNNVRRSSESKLRNEIENILNGNGLETTNAKNFFHYAYVDPRNSRSVKLCKEFGFETVRQFSTIIFHRMHAKDNILVETLRTDTDFKNMETLLTSFYNGFTMFSTENLFNNGNYYVLKDAENNILAGIQVNPDRWKILELPELKGKIILHLFSFLPWLNKIINKNYNFLTIEGVYYANGHEKSLEILIESVLAKYKLNSAMLWADTISSLYQSLHSMNLGIVSKLNKEVKADVICRCIGINHAEVEILKNNPAYISGTDLT